jgi:zinc/manganese transport system substrate-binding protein
MVVFKKHKILAAFLGMLLITLPLKAAIDVVTSFTVLQDLVKEVGKELVNVQTIVGADADAHVFRPTPATAKMVANADLVIINGLGFEGWIERLISASGYEGNVIIATNGISSHTMDDNGKEIQDPHAWHSIPNVRHYVKNIKEALVAYDPDNWEKYEHNARTYLKRLEALDAWVQKQINALPPCKRRVITAHDAFQYFGKEYGVDFKAPMGISTESEASVRDVVRLVRQIKDEGVRAVFIENMTDPKILNNIAREANVKVGGILYSDALSKNDGPASTYETMMRYNVSTLVAAMVDNLCL